MNQNDIRNDIQQRIFEKSKNDASRKERIDLLCSEINSVLKALHADRKTFDEAYDLKYYMSDDNKLQYVSIRSLIDIIAKIKNLRMDGERWYLHIKTDIDYFNSVYNIAYVNHLFGDEYHVIAYNDRDYYIYKKNLSLTEYLARMIKCDPNKIEVYIHCLNPFCLIFFVFHTIVYYSEALFNAKSK